MDGLEGRMQAVFRQAATDLGLEPHKTIKLESNSQLGHFLRVTKKVRGGGGEVPDCERSASLPGGEGSARPEEVLCAGDSQ